MINLELTTEELTLIIKSLYWFDPRWANNDETINKLETLYLKLTEISNRKVGD